MGTSPDLGVSGVHCTMRAVVFILLGAVAINAEAEADPLLVHHTGVGHTVAGVHPVHSVAPVAPVVHAGVKHVAGVYSHPFHYNYVYGKREAEAEADPLVYGVTHHFPAVHAGVTHGAGVYSHPYYYNVLYGKREAEADPLMYHHTGVAGVGGVHPVHTSVYNHHTGVHHTGVYHTYPYLG